MLPFVNAGADPQIEYLSDGITESIINSLSQLSGMRVVPRSLVFRYKGLQADPATVGLALNARTILTGRVTQQGDILNIQAELVDTATESQLWGEQFRQKISDLMAVQEEIAWQISEALRLKLTGEQKKRLRKRPTVNPDAYQEYLRGRYHWNNWTPDSFRRALEHFERAIALRPELRARLRGPRRQLRCDGLLRFRAAGLRLPARQRGGDEGDLARSRRRGCRMRRSPSAICSGSTTGRAPSANSRRRLRLNPKHAVARSLYAIFLLTLGRFDDAIREARSAQQLDPLSVLINMSVCWASTFAGRHEDCIRETRRTRELAPGVQEVGNVLMALYEEVGRFEEAAQIATEQPCYGVRVDGKALLDAYRQGGEPAYWRMRLAVLDDALSMAPPTIHYGYAVIYTRLGEREKAIDHLDQLVDAKTGNAVFVGGGSVAAHALVGAALPGHPQAAGRAHGFSTAYSVDMIGTGTPARSARRTTAPCSASTSIRFPCDRSISSDDRIVPGIPAT